MQHASCLHYCKTGRRASLTAAGPNRPNIIMSEGRYLLEAVGATGGGVRVKRVQQSVLYCYTYGVHEEVLYVDAVAYCGCARGCESRLVRKGGCRPGGTVQVN